MVGSAVPQPHRFPFPISAVGPTPGHLITTAASLRLGRFLHHRFAGHRLRLGFLLQSSFENISHLGHVPRLKDIWNERDFQYIGFDFLQCSYDAFSSLFFFGGEGNQNDSRGMKKSYSNTPGRALSNGRQWTNILLALNVLVYISQIATQGKLMLWGAKINSLINQGQLWRLITSAFLHANPGHLMINCYSLNSIGPSVENICGPRRFLAVYIISAIASAAASYWFCRAPAVGASGAIFGLVGSFAVFVLRHRSMFKGSEGDIQHIAQVIAVNLAIGYLSKGIDNWGHLGGLIGGVASSWLLGPAWSYESTSRDGRLVFADRAPIFSLIDMKRKRR